MTRARFIAWTLLTLGGFALLVSEASGRQQPKWPSKDNTAVSAVTVLRDTPRGGIPKEELKAARDNFAKFAKYYAEVVSHPDVWKAPQDLKAETPGAPTPSLEGPNGILRDLDRFLIEPLPGVTKTNTEPADYIRELGAALDAALKNLIETHADRIVRINAARVLAHVARTGAPAHFPTVTALLANANTPTEVKYYLFHAAGALLAAYDPYEIKVRKHATDIKTVGALVKALEDCITNPAMLLSGLPAGKAEEIPADQLAVIGFVRRQAVRALGQTKFVTVPGPDGKPLYPAYTLVRVAMADPALVPAPGPAEAAEAVIGLCNMAPVREQTKGGFALVKEYNADVTAEAITQALVTFAGPRAARSDDRSLPWRVYSLRIGEAMRNWRPLFDPEFEITQPAKYDPKTIPPAVEEMYKEIIPKVLAPMDTTAVVGAKVDLPWLRDRLSKLRENRKKTTLFEGVKETSIEFAAPKK